VRAIDALDPRCNRRDLKRWPLPLSRSTSRDFTWSIALVGIAFSSGLIGFVVGAYTQLP
jgi:hypothetical protein